MPRALLLALVVTTACAASPKVRPTEPPPPATKDGVEHRSETFAGTRGVELYARSWRAEGASPRAALIIVHGLRDHGDRYAGFAERLVGAGFVVHAADLRGHGRSAGERVWVDSFDDYVADLATYVERVRADSPDLPLFVMGHSMGGTIVVRYVETRKPELAGVVLSAPALGLHEFPLLPAMLVVNGGFPTSHLPLLLLNLKTFSRDDKVVAELRADPLITQDSPARTGKELAVAIGKAWDGAKAMTMPLLVVHGTGDQVTPPWASRDFVAAVPSEDRTFRAYPKLWHDLLHEPEADTVAGDIQGWLESHVAGAGTASDVPDARTAGIDEAGRASGSFRIGTGALREPGGDYSLDSEIRFRAAWGSYLFGATLGDERAMIYPIGLAMRLGAAGQLGVAAGVGSVRGAFYGAGPELSIDRPLGPVKLIGTGHVIWGFGRNNPEAIAAGISELSARAGFRLGNDRRLGRALFGGGGLFVMGTYERIVDADSFGVMIGLDFFGLR
jgi:acylglycerol lipase